MVAKVMRVKARSLKLRQYCDGVVSLIAAVESGAGPAVVGEFISKVAGDRVKFVPFSGVSLRLKVGILYRNSGLSERAKLFIEACRLS